MTGRPQILCAGRVYCDLIFTELGGSPSPGTEVFAGGLTLCAGGGAYITAAYFAALGGGANLMGVLPAAPFTTIVTDEMQVNGVTSFCTAPMPGDPQITVALAQGNDRSFVTRRTGPATAFVAGDALPKAQHLHIGELTTALEHPDLITAARVAGMTVSLDCGWDLAALSSDASAEMIAAVDVFLPNESEANELAGNGIAIAPRAYTVVKRGQAGATAIAVDGTQTKAAARVTSVRDTTGAGDAFNAGFLSGWLASAPVMQALDIANKCGACAVARIGGAGPLPDLSERHRFIPAAQ